MTALRRRIGRLLPHPLRPSPLSAIVEAQAAAAIVEATARRAAGPRRGPAPTRGHAGTCTDDGCDPSCDIGGPAARQGGATAV